MASKCTTLRSLLTYGARRNHPPAGSLNAKETFLYNVAKAIVVCKTRLVQG
ncbi:Hypothetical protein FKW44_002762 [Caligus rogercresseyi]|uniref:Uncharacterized protein n=1 Tax=Caligus rogercresseyi TaxID=217165 RepID=A0A7T8KKN7_CALRO|nr:Hypothetical protein FKW44_002762 [Caligus rogercresseyi]